ncbi:DUF3037 domain-containing protein [Burkholderia sp. WAC0059]|uniref:DUF3037 domain-containing protein n=1 Tax=Burkholderia sp. WAC0059 TaxID=2066022 RepID=UPI000C7EB9BD|nr:DUF3037 domain-containing protein [Burkholderia sp. WAC0059]PLZ01137.1 DUF3037 domain-containing protein [Burkholderia sp. WAC0059]
MKHACRYALIRFMPYTETGEFANVGIVLMSPTAHFFGFKLLDRVGRITAFFEELDASVYKRSRDTFRAELARVCDMTQRAFIGAVNGPSTDYANFVFDELVRPRQAIIYADVPRAMVEDDPARALDKLYNHYVGRSFVTSVYQERIVEQRVRNILKAADLQRTYQTKVLGTEYQARIPFVRLNDEGIATRLIKPLDLDRKDPTRLYDHGWEWLGKVKRLRYDQQLRGDAMFVVRPPEKNFDTVASIYADLKHELEHANIEVAEESDQDKILEFAAHG